MRLLVLASRPVAMPADIKEIREVLRQPIDWTAFVAGALQHGVTPQAFERLLEIAEPQVPGDIARAARSHIEQLRAHNRELIAELLAIVDGLNAASIDVIPLKGPLLAHLAYGDAIVRACRDLDFLVRRADIARVFEALGALGYRPYPDTPPWTARQEAALRTVAGQAMLARPGASAVIEPHWALVPGNLQLALDYEGIWRRARLISFGGRDVRVLAPEDLVLSIAIHGGKDQWSKLQAVADLARATVSLRALDWPVILARADRQRCLRMLLTGMRLTERLTGIPLEPAVAARCADDRIVDALAGAAVTQILSGAPSDASIFEVSRLRFQLHDRWSDRIRYVAATLVMPRNHHFGLVKLPDGLFFLYYGIKVVHDYVLLPIWLFFKRARVRPRSGPSRPA